MTALNETNVVAPIRVAYLIGRLDRALRRHIGEAVSPFGLTMQQYTALSVLASREQLSNAQLAERSFMTPQATSEMVKAMEGKGLIAREPDPYHGRIIHIRVTAHGRELLARSDEAVARLEAVMLAQLDAEERHQLHAQLKSCVHALGVGLVES
ncbi:MarR family winged helix-turn-helix transcriptional regulator [Phytohalomonas tamaricis]|uniref:MarR family winged helix-turn-helix transcriptional regulator n=1 Tax=Phytohalomonas tamaricis TaxID=2081032 RepID=UPI000D0B5007|nr:MarR family transcriptional regulator [Phytohalomonas tamaricis]